MARTEIEAGTRFGRLSAVELAQKDRHSSIQWRFVCDCGQEVIARVSYLRRGKSVSCGCVRVGSRYAPRHATVQDAFLAHLPAVTDAEACLEWQGAVGSHGYGELVYRQEKRSAHRLAWEFRHGPVADGKHVLHTCDNKRCCNPGHLFVGADRENVDDKVAKRRHRFGEGVPSAKLKISQVRRVKADRISTAASLARRYGVSASTIYRIRSNRGWLIALVAS